MKTAQLFLLMAVWVYACCSGVSAQSLQVPPRPANALSGSQVYSAITNLSLAERERFVYLEITRGNIPDFMRPLRPVTVAASGHTITYHVTCDYLAVGSNADFFRIPMTPTLAQWLADFTNCTLPTRKMVNDIWSASQTKLAPAPIPPSGQMITVPVFYDHHQMVEQQRVSAGAPLGNLIAGIKKDVVITPQLTQRPPPARVAIYGWHYQDGTAIQPLSLVHESTYADYSHGTRLIDNAVTVDGVTTTAQAVMSDSARCALLSDEGVQTVLKYPVPPAPATVVDWQLY